MRIVLFLDLDDTIFQTEPKCPAGAAIKPVARRRDGTPLSFMTDRQRAMLDVFFRTATVIPTTARNFDAFGRVDLPFDHTAILDFGGVVLLPDRSLDRNWDNTIRPQALDQAAELHAAHQAIERFIARRGLGATTRVVSDFDMPLYLVIKHPHGDSPKLEPIHQELLASTDCARFFVHGNDNNLSLVPRFLGKEKAVAYVQHHLLGPEPALTIGMGDSLTDAPFLELCDYGLTPRGCQLARHRFDTQDS